PYGAGRWTLFNLENDLAEENDLSGSHPAVAESLKKEWRAYAHENAVILPDWVSGY
ncbi:MAG: arylsulfatase, partial [Alphaproteobacteria bacterium]